MIVGIRNTSTTIYLGAKHGLFLACLLYFLFASKNKQQKHIKKHCFYYSTLKGYNGKMASLQMPFVNLFLFFLFVIATLPCINKIHPSQRTKNVLRWSAAKPCSALPLLLYIYALVFATISW